MEPILAPVLYNLGLNAVEVGFFFSIFPVAYIGTSFAQQYFSPKVEKRVRLIFAFAMNAVAFIMVGPSLILRLPVNLWLMGVGQFIGGAMMSMILQPTLIELIDTGEKYYPQHKESGAITNMSSGIFNCSQCFGNLVAPLYGTSVSDIIGFRLTMDILVAIDIAFVIAYFLLAGGVEAFGNTWNNLRNGEKVGKEIEKDDQKPEVIGENAQIN